MIYATNLDVVTNTAGNYSGTVMTVAERFQVAANAAFYMSGGNPILATDANDYMTYDRTANEFLFVIGGTTVARINASGLRLPTAPTSASGLSAGQIWNNSADARVA